LLTKIETEELTGQLLEFLYVAAALDVSTKLLVDELTLGFHWIDY